MDKEDTVHTHNGILPSHKKDKKLPFAATWMDLEIIILSEISQRKTNTTGYHLYIWDLKYDIPELIYETETDRRHTE